MMPCVNTPRLSNSYAGVPAAGAENSFVMISDLRCLRVTDAGAQGILFPVVLVLGAVVLQQAR